MLPEDGKSVPAGESEVVDKRASHELIGDVGIIREESPPQHELDTRRESGNSAQLYGRTSAGASLFAAWPPGGAPGDVPDPLVR